MDLRQLGTFRAVFELGSLSKASDRLRIAQPALSRQIQLLEHTLQAALFIRHGRGMQPTEAGRLLFERTSGLIRALEQAGDDVAASGGSVQGRVVVGMVPTISGALAATVARRVVAELPGVQLRMVDAYGNFLVDWLHRREIDLAVVYGPARQLHLSTESLRSDELFLVGKAGSGLAAHEGISLAQVADRPVVVPSAPHGLRAVIDAACAAANVDLRVTVEADSFQALIDIVTAGVGWTFLPWYAVAGRVEQGLLEAVPLLPALRRELVLALPDRQDISLAARAVADIVRTETAALVERGAD
jgi:DNA-binding transcriptional LysR family regulator